jgi:hypothetical protein
MVFLVIGELSVRGLDVSWCRASIFFGSMFIRGNECAGKF